MYSDVFIIIYDNTSNIPLVTPRSRNTYLVAYSDFRSYFSIYFLYLFRIMFCLGSGFMDSESALSRVCHSCDANPASAIPAFVASSRREPRVCEPRACYSRNAVPAFALPRPPKYPTLVFSPFSLSSPNASFTYLDSAFNAEILSSPPYAAFNAFQIKSHPVIMTFVLSLIHI